MIADEQARKLRRIAGRTTLYEATLTHHRTGEKALLCYSPKSRTSLQRYIAKNAQALVTFCGSETFVRRAQGEEAAIGEWGIAWSGRTQREAIINGELPWFGSVNKDGG